MAKVRFHHSIFTQAVLIIIGFALISLALSIYLHRQSMRQVALQEVENKAAIFLSSMETAVRRFVMDKESKRLTELIEDRAHYLENNLNFSIIRVVVRNPEGTILDHTRPEKIGDQYLTDDFKKVISSGQPLIDRRLKTLKLEPGQPELPVIEVIYPVKNRRKGDIQAVVKIIVDVRDTFTQIQKEYRSFSRKAVLGFTVTAALLVLGILLFLRRRIITPILSVAEGSDRIAAGDLDTRLVPHGSGEINNLMHSFNQMAEGLKHRDQMRHSLEVAMEVQQNLLPKENPDFSGLDIAGTSVYCDETGGDYYDFLQFPERQAEQVGIVIGDVSGHGISSALLMATARAFLRQRSAKPGTIVQVVSDVNVQLTRDVADSGSFMSMFYMNINREQKRLTWVRAGHDPALFYDPADYKIEELKGAGLSLGIDEHWQFEENVRANLAEGQIVVLGTDGIWEARNPASEMFGKQQLHGLIKEYAHLDAQAILTAILESLAEFQDGAPSADDVTLIVVKILPEF